MELGILDIFLWTKKEIAEQSYYCDKYNLHIINLSPKMFLYTHGSTEKNHNRVNGTLTSWNDLTSLSKHYNWPCNHNLTQNTMCKAITFIPSFPSTGCCSPRKGVHCPKYSQNTIILIHPWIILHLTLLVKDTPNGRELNWA